MNQLVEMRFNPVYMPGKTEKEPYVRFDELIFVSAQKTYELDVQYNSAQKVETLVTRMVADEGGKVNLIANLSQLLPNAHPLRIAVEKWMDAETAKKEKNRKGGDLFDSL